MKYLKTINELRSDVYTRAAYKLNKLGQTDRAEKLKQWGNVKAENEQLAKWEENKKIYSKFGKIKLKITTKNTTFTGDFYLDIVLDRDSFEDQMAEEWPEDNYNNCSFWAGIGIIPADDMTLAQCMDELPEPDLHNGFFWGLSLLIEFKLNNKVEFTDMTLENYDTALSGDVKIADRPNAGRFRTMLIKMFSDPNYNYPSGYIDFEYFYDYVNTFFGATMGLESDYGFTSETIADYIKTVSANKLI